MQPITRVIFVRHGRSTFNDQGRYQGSSNQSVLTAKGIETSQLVGQCLSHAPIDTIYTSPLQRVQQTTAEIAAQIVHHSPITVSPDLKEISLSHWEGLTYAQVKEQFTSDDNRWQHQPYHFKLLASTESSSSGRVAIAEKPYFPVRDLYQRARQFWDKMLAGHAGSTILIVSHSGTIHALLSTALGTSPTAHHSLQQSNCGISELTITGQSFSQSTVQLHQLNQTSAIGETLPKLKVSKKGLRLLLLPENDLSLDSGSPIVEKLKTMPIDFCLSGGNHLEQLQPIIQNHPKAIWLDAQKSDFLQDWHRHLCQPRRVAESLMTGLAIAPTHSIQKLLLQVLGGVTNDGSCLSIYPSHLSVIHYPYTHRPVVQTINL